MRLLASAAAVSLLLVSTADAQTGACATDGSGNYMQSACKKSPGKTKAQAGQPGMSRAEEEKLDRGMARNVLQSIEDQARLRRLGN